MTSRGRRLCLILLSLAFVAGERSATAGLPSSAVAPTGHGSAAKQSLQKPTTPREMFAALGVGDAYFHRLADGRQLQPGEKESLWRILFRLRLFPAIDMDRWALDQSKLGEALARPNDFRGSIFRLHGRIVSVEPCKPPADAAQRFELPEYFRCRLKLDAPNAIADVYTENVPEAWKKGAKPNAPGGALATFLKIADKGGQQPCVVFAAPRLAWHPDNLLGTLGMDVGLLDAVRDQKPITPQETDAFYGLLAAVGRAKPGELLRKAEADLPHAPAAWRWTTPKGDERYSVAPLFNEPAAQRGRLIDLYGVARRVEEVRIADPALVARFGFDHYYQVLIFTDDSYDENSNQNPLTFCVRELPKGMPVGNTPRYGETVRIAGFFFKTWSYHVPKATDPSLTPNPKTHRQLSPLLIGRDLTWYPEAKPAEDLPIDAIVSVLFCLLAVFVLALAWRSRGRRRWKHQVVEEPRDLDSIIKLDDRDDAP